MDLHYHLLNPTGNVTVLVETDVENSLHSKVGEQLLKIEKKAEQVGYILPGKDDYDIELQMASNEFCGNATISTAAYYVYRNPISEGEVGKVIVKASGMDELAEVEITNYSNEKSYYGKVKVPFPSSIEEVLLTYGRGKYLMNLVDMGETKHLILLGTMKKEDAEAAIKEWANELNINCLGIISVDIEKKIITPLVYVRDLDSLYWESSCASGTIAAGAFIAKENMHEIEMSFNEPGGVLTVKAHPDGPIYLSGKVDMMFIDKTVSIM